MRMTHCWSKALLASEARKRSVRRGSGCLRSACARMRVHVCGLAGSFAPLVPRSTQTGALSSRADNEPQFRWRCDGGSISVNTFSVQKHKCWLARERSIRKLIKVVQYVWVLRSTQVSPLASTPPQNADGVVKTNFESLISQASWFPCQQCTWSLSAWQTSCSQLFYEVLKHMADTLDFIEEKLLYQKRTALMRHPVMGSWAPDSLCILPGDACLMWGSP